jgi:hypothetical protein
MICFVCFYLMRGRIEYFLTIPNRRRIKVSNENTHIILPCRRPKTLSKELKSSLMGDYLARPTCKCWWKLKKGLNPCHSPQGPHRPDRLCRLGDHWGQQNPTQQGQRLWSFIIFNSQIFVSSSYCVWPINWYYSTVKAPRTVLGIVRYTNLIGLDWIGYCTLVGI